MEYNSGRTRGVCTAIITGILFAIFGLFIFSEVPNDYALFIRICIVLCLSCILGSLWGFRFPALGWRWGLLLGGPGFLSLVFLILSGLLTGAEFDYTVIIAILYAVMLLLAPSLGAWGGSVLRSRRKK